MLFVFLGISPINYIEDIEEGVTSHSLRTLDLASFRRLAMPLE